MDPEVNLRKHKRRAEEDEDDRRKKKKSKKERHEREGKKEKERRNKYKAVKVVDDDPDMDDIWVEKDIDMGGENVSEPTIWCALLKHLVAYNNGYTNVC